LFPEEKMLFPKEYTSPCQGVGRTPDDERFKIVNYQLTLNVCPHLDDNVCRIYEKRPLICRAYPFKGSTIEPDCAFKVELSKRFPNIDEFYFASNDEILISDQIARKIRESYKSKQKQAGLWEYDLMKKKWLLSVRTLSP
jgi:Fe-S-cluster containining protein